ncbi:VCBS repeat-containing protein [Thermomonas sp.]|uniref:FG-GAP repeat domain-containing protein n=1 Tax=Thermomonas sp. TaxID=1971895 RepID=UPI0024880568|nr:VCBS repeat-containing protein [Thermomonas sp.]MDI1253001.1 VCBS repeat-containing protein [Thermomonas sp.]
MSPLRHALYATFIAFFASLVAGCGGGGGGSSSGTGTGGGGPIVNPPPPPPSNSVNRNFSFNPLKQYPPQLVNQEGKYWGAAVAIGDVTGDGRPDVVMTTEGTEQTSTPSLISQVMVFPQLPDKTLGEPVHAPFLSHYAWATTGMALGDLDNDGVQEILVGHQDGLSIAKFRPSTNSLEMVTLPDPVGYSAVTTGDFDGDGKVDVVAQTWSSGAVLYKGDGTGGLLRFKDLATPLAGYNRIIARDMNKDQKPDLVMTNGQGFAFWYLMLNEGNGTFAAATSNAIPRRTPIDWPWMARGVDTADLNGDGRPDVVTSLVSNRPAGIAVYLAQANGGYQLDKVLDSFDIPEPVVIADLDGNGLKDIITLHGGFFNMGYYLQGPGGFEPETMVTVSLTAFPTSHYRPDGLAAGDINSDGCIDVVLADYQHGLLVRTGAKCKR